MKGWRQIKVDVAASGFNAAGQGRRATVRIGRGVAAGRRVMVQRQVKGQRLSSLNTGRRCVSGLSMIKAGRRQRGRVQLPTPPLPGWHCLLLLRLWQPLGC